MDETWEDRFKRAVANHAGVPADVPLTDITVEVTGEDGYSYSSYTFADPSITVTVRWSVFGERFPRYKDINGPSEIAELIQSFLPPKDSVIY